MNHINILIKDVLDHLTDIEKKKYIIHYIKRTAKYEYTSLKLENLEDVLNSCYNELIPFYEKVILLI